MLWFRDWWGLFKVKPISQRNDRGKEHSPSVVNLYSLLSPGWLWTLSNPPNSVNSSCFRQMYSQQHSYLFYMGVPSVVLRTGKKIMVGRLHRSHCKETFKNIFKICLCVHAHTCVYTHVHGVSHPETYAWPEWSLLPKPHTLPLRGGPSFLSLDVSRCLSDTLLSSGQNTVEMKFCSCWG